MQLIHNKYLKGLINPNAHVLDNYFSSKLTFRDSELISRTVFCFDKQSYIHASASWLKRIYTYIKTTSSDRLRTRSALSRRNHTSELSGNYLFKVGMLLMSHSVITILPRLLNKLYRCGVRISHPWITSISFYRKKKSINK